MIKISIQESLLRSMIRHLLIEEEGPPVQITPNSTWIQYKDKGNLVGKKFSATHNGEPNFVIIYDNANFGYMNLDDLKIAVEYSNSNIVAIPKHGRELTTEEIMSIDMTKFFESYKTSQRNAISYISSLKEESKENIAFHRKEIYKHYKIFVPDLMKIYKPTFAATEGGKLAAEEGRCTIESDEIGKFFSMMKNYLFPGKKQLTSDEKLQIMTCFKAATIDSNLYAIFQGLLGLTGVGLVAEVLLDAIPGIILCDYYVSTGNDELAIQIAALTMIGILVPYGFDRFIKKAPTTVTANVIDIVKSGADDIDSILTNPDNIKKVYTSYDILRTLTQLGVTLKLMEFIINIYENNKKPPPSEALVDKVLKEIVKEVESTDKSFQEILNNKLTNAGFRQGMDPQGLIGKYPDI